MFYSIHYFLYKFTSTMTNISQETIRVTSKFDFVNYGYLSEYDVIHDNIGYEPSVLIESTFKKCQ